MRCQESDSFLQTLIALLRNVGKASITLPKHLREDRELQTLAHECEQTMVTARSSEEQAIHDQLSQADPEPEPREKTCWSKRALVRVVTREETR